MHLCFPRFLYFFFLRCLSITDTLTSGFYVHIPYTFHKRGTHCSVLSVLSGIQRLIGVHFPSSCLRAMPLEPTESARHFWFLRVGVWTLLRGWRKELSRDQVGGNRTPLANPACVSQAFMDEAFAAVHYSRLLLSKHADYTLHHLLAG